MYKSTNTRYSTFPLDKENEKWYSESVRTQLNLSAFDDDEVAGSAVDYLYAPGNQSKTQSFLKNNGFPSAQEREFGKALQGIEQERKQLADTLRSTVKTPVSTEHYGESDRAFMHGLLGDEAGEREYQKRVANVNAQNVANTRKQNELLNAFKGSQFESMLKPTAHHFADTADDEIGHTVVYDFDKEYDKPEYFDSKTVASTTSVGTHDNRKNTYTYSANKVENEVKLNGSALTEEDWDVYGALQRKGQSGVATDLLFSVEEATKAYAAAGDNLGKKNAARIKAVEARQAAYKKIGKTYVDNYDYTHGAGNSVFLGVHQVAGDNYHTSTIIMIHPDSPLYNTGKFKNITESSPIQYMTLGAGPTFLAWGDLQSGTNRKKDKIFDNKVDMINLNVSDAAVMAKLIACEETYRQNQLLKYFVFPEVQTELYNSNSFTSGLLKACNVTAPENLNYNVPGWEKAVPIQYFIK